MLLPSVSRSISTCMYLKDLGRAWACHVDQLTLRTTKDLRKNYYPKTIATSSEDFRRQNRIAAGGGDARVCP